MTAASQPILRSPALRALEDRHRDSEPPLMERAGRAAAEVARSLLPDNGTPLIVAGPGNNGGDGLVVARLLKEQGIAPIVVLAGAEERLPADARAALDAWRWIGGECLADMPERHIGPVDLVVDALFGIGLARALDGRHARLVERINALAAPVLALDVPSGLDSESGRMLGTAVRATHTATFIALKPGLLTADGPDCAGKISVHSLDLDVGRDGLTVSPALFGEHLAPRRRNSHKGTFGSVGILGGAPGMAGAALLAGRAALHLGAGRVYVGMLERLPCDPLQPELMLREPGELLERARAGVNVLAVGPGLGQSPAAVDLLRRALDSALPLVLDADALNLLAAHPVLMHHAATRAAPTLLTPHPAEAARLAHAPVEAVQADRVGQALKLSQRLNAHVLLKGCGSVIATPEGRWFINTTGNPGLASAGSGDVLTGMTAALLAQGWPAAEALLAAVHLHGAAADAAVSAGAGPAGLTAQELIAPARALLNAWSAHA